MQLTDPFTGMFSLRKMTDAELATAMRLDIMAELDAISLYQAHMLATDNEDAKKVLAHVIREEQEHAAEFLEMLKILDPAQAEELAHGPADFASVTGHLPQARPAQAGQEAQVAAADKSAMPGLTVGNLFLTLGPLVEGEREIQSS